MNEISAENFVQARANEGWTEQNTNGSARIFFSPNRKTVLRLSSDKDYAFLIYADLCAVNKTNPYFQNIFDHWVLPDGSHVAHMERLVEVPNLLGDLSTVKRAKKAKELGTFLTNMSCPQEIEAMFFVDQSLKDALRILYMTIDDLAESDYSIAAGLDLHAGNIMLRVKQDGTTQPVIIDPFQEGNGQDYYYYKGEKRYAIACTLETLGARDLVLRRKLGLMEPRYLEGIDIGQGPDYSLTFPG